MNLATDNQSNAGATLETQLEALRAFWNNITENSVNQWTFQIRRWRQETSKIILEYFGDRESSQFEKISVELDENPSDYSESIEIIIKKIDAYLVTLLDSVWTDRIKALTPVITKTTSISKLKSTKPTVHKPETVTLAWLANHVPVTIWAAIISFILAIFIIGLKTGQTETGRDILSIIGFSVYTTSYITENSIENTETGHIVRAGIIAGRDYIKVRPKKILSGIKSFATTTREANDYQVKHFSDKWIHIEGQIYDITGISELASIVMRVDGVNTSFLLREDQLAKLDHLQNGDKIVVEGQFAHAETENGVEFIEAEIID